MAPHRPQLTADLDPRFPIWSHQRSTIVLLGSPSVGGNVIGIGFADFLPASVAVASTGRSVNQKLTADRRAWQAAPHAMCCGRERRIKAALSMCARPSTSPRGVVRFAARSTSPMLVT